MKQLKFKQNNKYDLANLYKQLDRFGYERVGGDLNVNEYSVNGSLIAIKDSEDNYYLLDFFGSVLESIWSVDKKGLRNAISEFEISSNMLKLDDGSYLRPGSYVVHLDSGIGIYHGLGHKVVEGERKPYIFIEYLNNSFLYVPLALKERLALYVGAGNRKPRLSSLGTQTWAKTKQKAYESVILMAKELLNIYAKREIITRESYKISHEWDKELKKSFGFLETIDQAKAISAVYDDLEKNKPMDRLICGDVGFGKTEVAIRAGGQAIANGYQVLLLCPTTILAMQHYKMLSSRFSEMPINFALLSRFQNKKEQADAVLKLKSGGIDFVIGTHRLLSNDIKFKNLGLVIIDEEQRFGVKQKEKFKRVRESVNVLSLSATPIPRTLFMALSGIRDISEINTPPKGRKSIETEVVVQSDEKIKEYIQRELSRQGQVYFLHNEVSTIPAVAVKIKKMFPKARVGVAHGQMAENSLANAMSQFSAGEIDILICSTIMENGLDISNVNTLIVHEADRFGLSQLYQIRGRIGRSDREAYCLLTHKNKKITEDAIKRLRTLTENVELGSGYNIALSDLEIRGGGNVLGREQHGTMEAIGLILYSSMLKQAVNKLKKN